MGKEARVGRAISSIEVEGEVLLGEPARLPALLRGDEVWGPVLTSADRAEYSFLVTAWSFVATCSA